MEEYNKINSADEIKEGYLLIQDKFSSFNEQIKRIIEFSEKEFLGISEKLQNFHSSAKEITRLSTTLTNTMSGEIIGKSISELQEMLLRINKYLESIKDKFDSGRTKLELVCSILNDISEKTAYFQYIVKHLRILGISTKIESARLGTDEQGFNTLADNVDALSEKITDKSTGIKDKTSVLLQSAFAAKSTIVNLSDIENENSNKIIANSEKSLNSLVSQYQSCASEVKKIANRSEKISKDIGQVVISIQYHDITKQQLDHVKEAFEGISNKIKKNRTAGTLNIKKELSIVYDTCQVQNAQLLHSKDDLCSATEKMVESLFNIGKNVSAIYSELTGLFEKGNSDRNSVLSGIEKNLISVSETLTNNSEVEGKLIKSIDSVANTINELSSFVGEISEIGTEIELIALNASIKSAHTGENGAPMGIIAESIQKLSKEAKEQTAVIIDFLSSVTVTANQLHSELTFSQADGTNNELNNMTANISSLLKILEKYNIENNYGLEKIKQTVKELYSRIDATAQEVKIHSEFREFVKSLSGELNSLMQDSIFFSKNSSKIYNLNNLQSNYTMESERDIFKKIMSDLETNNFNIHKKNDPAAGDEGLGGNVELF